MTEELSGRLEIEGSLVQDSLEALWERSGLVVECLT